MAVFHDLDKLAAELSPRRSAGEKIVLANGAFDLLHVGHLRYLKAAKALGDILVVAVNSDESVRQLKGPGRPVVPLAERLELLDGLACVDYVIGFEQKDVRHIIEKLRPHFHAKGTDYTEKTVPEADVARAAGCRTVIVGPPKNHSTSDIISAARLGEAVPSLRVSARKRQVASRKPSRAK